MSHLSHKKLDYIRSEMKYIAEEETDPAFYLYDPGTDQPPPSFDKTIVKIYNVRSVKTSNSLDKNGFEFAHQELPSIDFLEDKTVKDKYYPTCAKIVADATGASRVIAFDHNIRDYDLATVNDAVSNPVRFVHNDYTEISGPQRVRDLLDNEADILLESRYAFINVWRPLKGPVHDFPLAIIDADTLSESDFVEASLKYADRTGQIYSVKNNPDHRWYYLNEMQTHEILLLKCFDSSKDGRSRYTAHSSFKNPNTPKTFLPRRSIETRTIAFF